MKLRSLQKFKKTSQEVYLLPFPHGKNSNIYHLNFCLNNTAVFYPNTFRAWGAAGLRSKQWCWNLSDGLKCFAKAWREKAGLYTERFLYFNGFVIFG
ncbi:MULTISPECIES: hypothetical protein [unclassified Neisseria]|uniref:hypothetical protein n=1 Tax=unclassified Neisseria TaxID=2623750 RepID=UPI001071AD76|nr:MULTISPECIES: hypothetical protein [unclassified Neisseria]MBF0802992.1 hypothetical protein [Neisseria sp. 19428wB4_WF04]TFU44516.1 hypothetical protein E4T99_01190 [Neisseria sp. WF04]